MRLTTGTLLVGIFAILFALIGAYALRAALAKDPPPPAAGPRSITVPIAAMELAPGRKILMSDMVLISMTAKDIEERQLPLQTLMIMTEQIIGRVLKSGMKQGDAFLTTNLYPEGELPDLAEKLAPGLRAFTIPIDDFNGVGGAVRNGSFVDVLFRTTARPGDQTRQVAEIPEATVTLVENVQIIAVNRQQVQAARSQNQTTDIRQSNRAAPTVLNDLGPLKAVTLAVTPDQANVLKAAMGRGEMSIDLRREVDDGTNKLGAITLEKILGVKAPTPPTTVETWIGGSRGTLTWDEYGNPLGGSGSGGGSGGGSHSQANGGGLHYYGNINGFGTSGLGPGGAAGGGPGMGTRTSDLPNSMLPIPGGMGSPRGVPQGAPGGPGGGAGAPAPMPSQSTQGYLPSNPQANWALPNGDAYGYYSSSYSYPYAPPGVVTPRPYGY